MGFCLFYNIVRRRIGMRSWNHKLDVDSMLDFLRRRRFLTANNIVQRSWLDGLVRTVARPKRVGGAERTVAADDMRS